MFIYFSREQVFNRDFRGPDFFAVLDIDGSYPRQAWVTWDEQGRYPNVIVELMSSSTSQIDLTTKKDLYERTFRTSHYIVYDPFNPSSLQGWQLGNNQRYQELTLNNQGWLWLGTWEGIIDRESAIWLRFYDREGQLVLLPEEAASQRAEIERQKSERLAAKLRELGVDPNDL